MKVKKVLTGDKVFNGFVNICVAVLALLCLYPLWLVLINSISDPNAVNLGKIWIVPVGFSLDAYKEAFANGSIVRGYINSLTQTLVGTAVSMLLTIPAAYALSKQSLKGRGFFMLLIVITMYFSGGLVPSFINMKELRLLNNWWVIPLSGAVASYNLIIARTFFAGSIPRELEEAAEIDGSSIPGTFIRIVLPLSKAMLGVILLYYLVGYWNNFTSALYYMPATDKYWPLQMVLRNMIQNITLQEQIGNQEMMDYYARILEQIKYSVIVIAALPLLIIYPFLQKYFDKGVMLGSIKG